MKASASPRALPLSIPRPNPPGAPLHLPLASFRAACHPAALQLPHVYGRYQCRGCPLMLARRSNSSPWAMPVAYSPRLHSISMSWSPPLNMALSHFSELATYTILRAAASLNTLQRRMSQRADRGGLRAWWPMPPPAPARSHVQPVEVAAGKRSSRPRCVSRSGSDACRAGRARRPPIFWQPRGNPAAWGSSGDVC